MNLNELVCTYKADLKGERAIFEAAMCEKIESPEGYKMSDLMFDVYQCQRDINILNQQLSILAVDLATILEKISGKKGTK